MDEMDAALRAYDQALVRASESFADELEAWLPRLAVIPKVAQRMQMRVRNLRLRAEWIRFPARELPIAEQVKLGMLTHKQAAEHAAALATQIAEDHDEQVVTLDGRRRRRSSKV
jgi:hypothetical protein